MVLYKEEGISFNDTWLEGTSPIVFNDSDNDESSESLSNTANSNMESLICPTGTECNKSQQTSDDEDHWSEDEAEICAGITDTMLTAPDFITDNEWLYILNVAPGKGNRSISIFRDKYSEELAYPGIFLGQKRPDNVDRLSATSYPGSLPTSGAADKTLVAAGHVNPQILGVNQISAFLLLREEW